MGFISLILAQLLARRGTFPLYRLLRGVGTMVEEQHTTGSPPTQLFKIQKDVARHQSPQSCFIIYYISAIVLTHSCLFCRCYPCCLCSPETIGAQCCMPLLLPRVYP